MPEAGQSLREWIKGSRLTAGRVTASHIVEAGRRFEMAMPPLTVIRPADLLVLEFRFDNLRRSGGRLARANSGEPALLIVAHQPQSFGEEAFPEITNDQADLATDDNLDGIEPGPGTPPRPPKALLVAPAPQSRIRAAGLSRLVYRMPSDISQIDWSLEALLRACREWPLHLDGSAEPDPEGVRFSGGFQLEALSRDLLRTVEATRVALGDLGRPVQGALDALAERLAGEGLAAARAEGPARPSTFRRQLDTGLRRLRAGERRDPGEAAVDEVLRAMYVHAEASRRVVAEIGRADDPFVMVRIPPELLLEFLRPDRPTERETALEMPYRLIASPLPGAGFTHALAPVTHHGLTELWHSRLGTRSVRGGEVHVDDRPGRPGETGGWDGEKLRFIWSPDYPDGTVDTFNKPLDHLDRQMLVKLTAGFNELRQDGKTRFTPRAAYVRRLMLTALGGDLEAHRKFDPRPQGVDLSAWTHRSTIGRDHYVRVEYSGFLFPVGHRATLVKVTERKFQWRSPGERVAVLRQRFFIIVRDRMIAYPGAEPQPHDGRSLPFERIICALEGATPDLAPPGGHPDDRVRPVTGDSDPARFRMAFWPSRGGGVDYRFPLVGIDSAGRKTAFEMPLLFISELKNTAADIPHIRNHWNGGGKASQRRIAPLAGQTVRMAPATDEAKDVDVPLVEAEIRAVDPTAALSPAPGRTLQQYPRFGESKAKLAALERLTGVSRVERIAYHDPYLEDGLDPDSAVFARIVGGSKVAFGSDAPSSTVGGLATPDLTPTGLSARHGIASGDIATFAGGRFEPSDFFPDAKLLGFFPLKDLLRPLDLDDSGATPKITTVELPDRIRTRFSLVQDLEPGEKITGLFMGAGGNTSVFALDSVIDAPLGGAAPETSVTGTLTNFRISFFGALVIHFDRLRFFTRPGAKPDVDVDLNPDTGVTFGGPLEFINKLREVIPANGFSDPPNLDVTPAGITAGYTLGLPAVQVGILALSNISLGAAFSLPFTGKPPTARFNFAERQNTFNLTVSMFGGGGFVAIVAGTDGIKEIEAQLDFGAQIAINLGVASGSVYVKGGFYFHYAQKMVLFEGFVELGGRLSVLGLISVSLTFHLGLTYELIEKSPDNDNVRSSRLFGQATLTVEIEILFFSASVDVTVEKTFVGSEADPSFLDLVPKKALWDEYCAAYA
ncbi:MAG TPA: hypothetical protein VD846_03610 [Allosphingosinicella sp.]|nr:hypothetical protein [Allosphingosinicella sp.]